VRFELARIVIQITALWHRVLIESADEKLVVKIKFTFITRFSLISVRCQSVANIRIINLLSCTECYSICGAFMAMAIRNGELIFNMAVIVSGRHLYRYICHVLYWLRCILIQQLSKHSCYWCNLPDLKCWWSKMLMI